MKTMEMRLNDEKRRGMQVGDRLTFISRETGETLMTEVIGKFEYPTFDALLEHHPATAMGYKEKPAAGAHGLYEYYSVEDEARWGVVGLEIRIVQDDDGI